MIVECYFEGLLPPKSKNIRCDIWRAIDVMCLICQGQQPDNCCFINNKILSAFAEHFINESYGEYHEKPIAY